jgi:hypothetical protein
LKEFLFNIFLLNSVPLATKVEPKPHTDLDKGIFLGAFEAASFAVSSRNLQFIC